MFRRNKKEKKWEKGKDVPNLPFLHRRHGPLLRDQIIIHHHPGAHLQRRDRRPQDPHHVRVRPVVEDVAEQIHVRARDGLREEEVVRHEGDAVPEVGGDGVGSAADHVREVLDDEGEVGVRLGEDDADVATGAADVDDGAGFGGGGVGVAVGRIAVGGVAVEGVAADGRPGIAVS